MWAEAAALGGTESDQRAHRRWGFRAGPTLGPRHQARWSRWSRAGSLSSTSSVSNSTSSSRLSISRPR